MSREIKNLRDKLWQRGELLRMIRDYFFLEEVVEVDTPIMSQFGNPDPALLNFKSRYNGPGRLHGDDTYLITSPEYHMKRLLAAGSGSCYYLGKVFRDGELSHRHNPEFTMLEWYREGFDLETLMEEVYRLLRLLSAKPLERESYSYQEAFLKFLQIDPFTLSFEALLQFIEDSELSLTFTPRDRDEALDLIVSHLLEPQFDPDKVTFLYHYPATQASLAKIVEEEGNLVGKRFEAYWQGLELANGYEELTESHEQRARFEAENKARQQIGYEPVPLDHLLLESLDQLPFCSGVALGVDRLLMAIWGKEDIADVQAFGFEQS
ncbi:EF-P lysine aminoacylase EpmA [Ignatzschineria cameli]|nr:EF-P lysine aminoacylase EpmA [Ignatzschineria cameli]